MSTRTSQVELNKKNAGNIGAAAAGLLLGWRQGMEPRRQRRVRLLSAFLMVQVLVTLISAIPLRNVSTALWAVMMATAFVLVIAYFISRTRYYVTAIRLALTVPVVNLLAAAVLDVPAINLLSLFIWLMLPLLVSSLLLTARQTMIVAGGYLLFIIVLVSSGAVPNEVILPLTSYIVVIAFLVVTVSLLRHKENKEMDTYLQKLQQSEKAFRESEEKFAKVFRLSPQEIVIVNKKTDKTIEVNDSFTRTSGFKREDIVGHTSSELNVWTDPGDRHKMLDMLQQEGRIRNLELEFRNKSGEILYKLFSAELITLAGEECIITVTTDITDRKRMERALIDETNRRRMLIEQSRDGIVILDKDGKVLEVNQRFAEMLGYTIEEAQHLYVFDWEFKYSHQQVINMILSVDEKGDHFVTQHRRKDGTIYDVAISTNGTTVAGQKLIFCVCRDITEQKQMELALRESEEKFSKAFLYSPLILSIIRAKDGAFLEVNETYLHTTGYTREEIIGHSGGVLDDMWVNHDELVRITRQVSEQGGYLNEEFSFRMKSGEIRQWLASGEIVSIGGEPCLLVVGADITERKRAEEKLKSVMLDLEQSSAQLKATNKELESFSYSVSHDLRSPLWRIKGFSQALLEDEGDKLEAKGRAYLDRIQHASRKMEDLIDGMLTLSRLTRNEMHLENVDLSAMAGEIVARLRETFPERQVEFIIAPGLNAEGDPQMLQILLENLLGNAMKFTGKTPQARIEFGRTEEQGRPAFFIRDNGAGFDMKEKARLFGTFQRLHSEAEFPGTGIGLATVQRIINRHGGTIRAEGAVGKGAAFYFTLHGAG